MMTENEMARMVRRAIVGYFRDLDGEKPCAVYDMVIHCVEKPLLESVLRLMPSISAAWVWLPRTRCNTLSSSGFSTQWMTMS